MENTYKCPICGEEFESENDRDIHQSLSHPALNAG
jgi:hypothetical protein